MFSDPSGMFSESQVMESLDPMAKNFDTFLNNIERHRIVNSHVKWGFIAALLDAHPGDRLESYRVSIIDPGPPRWVQVSDSVLGYGTKGQNAISITADGRPVSSLYSTLMSGGYQTASLFPPQDARYYVLYARSGEIKRYIDGSVSTDYPDFLITTLGVGDGLKMALQSLGKGVGKAGCISYSWAQITDRYGQQYTINTISAGASISLLSHGAGWASQDLARPSSFIPDPLALRNTIEGLSFGGSGYMGAGVTLSFSPASGAGAVSITEGLQLGADVEGSLISYSATNGAMAWDWATRWEAGEYGSPPAIFQETLLTWR
jgi:hypothetical protein